MARKLPAWLTRRDDGVLVIDPDLAYPAVLAALGVKEADIDQYWIEVAYQSCKMFVQDLVEGTEFDPRSRGVALQIHIMAGGTRKDRWALANHPEGRGIERATKGLEAKRHYQRIRNLIG